MKRKIKNDNKKDPFMSTFAYDDAFRTMETMCDDILIPFVGHMFGEYYGKDAIVKRLRNEHFVENENMANEKRITDSNFEITYQNVTKMYHLECESKTFDGTILVRLVEYNTLIALENAEKSLDRIRLTLSNPGLLLLKGSNNAVIPDKAAIELVAPDGKEMSYNVSIVKVWDYSVDEIFKRQLFMLIPFIIFNYEKELPKINESNEAIDDFFKRYGEIFKRLKTELNSGNLSTRSYNAIIDLTLSVAYKFTQKHGNVQKRVGDIMGGKVLDLECFRIYDEGFAAGEAKNKQLIHEQAEKIHVQSEEIQNLSEEVSRLKRELEALKNNR